MKNSRLAAMFRAASFSMPSKAVRMSAVITFGVGFLGSGELVEVVVAHHVPPVAVGG